jgi:hypothetical protein
MKNTTTVPASIANIHLISFPEATKLEAREWGKHLYNDSRMISHKQYDQAYWDALNRMNKSRSAYIRSMARKICAGLGCHPSYRHLRWVATQPIYVIECWAGIALPKV